MSKTKITVIGSNMMDLITNINRMPRLGETIEAPDFDLGFGGKGANQAVAAAKIGSEVVMLSKVGDGLFGREVIKNFKSFGIDTEYVEVVKNTTSGVAPIFVDKDGNNRILIVKGANAHLKPADIDRAKDKILGSDFILLQLEIPLETVYHAIDFGVENEIPVILNPAPAAELDFKYVKKASIFIPNETELETITKMPVDSLENIKKAAESLLTQELEKIIVTMGEKGSLLVSKDITELVPAYQIEPRDTTGAGDAFIGSFANFYAETKDILKAMEMANKYAALSTLNTGTQKSFYSREDFEKYFE
ncbi:ribokinase [Halanaerobium kushneri]|uniref:Deoxyribokinase n=1 Tax=Halanaerobium kushneri TaxID=56779 RepID=A0A1N6ZIZ4_9FIRM|nr:ribokinase [Halanaerobium kushneri]SIR26870.1 ribokinase [Halanaerobium kushneri]